MPRTKRIRAVNEDLQAFAYSRTKRLKRTDTISSELSNDKTSTDLDSNTEKNGDAVAHTMSTLSESIADKLLSVEQQLSTKVQSITFQSSVQYIYNPLEYAFDTHAMYVRKYCNGSKKILFLGMNPGPWGMSQTGVPFGEISMVRDWLKISGSVGTPSKEHPNRKVTGFQCTRSEVSGKRLWGLFQDLCGSPEKFFQNAYMHNYCPLALMDTKARNITPAELKGEGQELLHRACDKSLVDAVQLLKVEIIVGIGKYAEKRAQIAAQTAGLQVQVMFLPHPSPRAVGNGNWNEKAIQHLEELKLMKFFKTADT
ncbi:single-strand selective monofunctional uracil DNA glycosylase [Harpegnathos saltator]|uniref:single-strand selective monofunctional uracil DNA glycosylase n=1 Tax=Harpegnathos saltator TaxID=610380 RepID=UPI00058F4B62|nr:single-strand selective monofunctional uracil DNA glycosylase [Harpegnathos saltator]XP_025163093.1 single-strand selective monofunctional uracil DNA glycosylase [Harpegnathos saltator]